eukprot:TRINITY_DN76718_c0_g1_i1.p1 TRINITY_DN76718_c0_g1~~TRINITY_DN76718_c0_g1_i1.p1  ORF type:complete len:194 (+),score=59.29 TRINITY_DN76718_c0_g1_i1:250-831(+)
MSCFDEKDILYSGFLHKLGAVNKAWKDRWFVLVGTKLYYFRAKDQRQPQGTVEVRQGWARPGDDANQPCSFEIITAQRVYLLAAPSPNNMQKWVNVLNSVSEVALDNEMFSMMEARIQVAEIEKNTRHDAEVTERGYDDGAAEEDEEEEDDEDIDDDDDEDDHDDHDGLGEEDPALEEGASFTEEAALRSVRS